MHRKLSILAGLFIASALVMFVMVYFSVTSLDSIRAYVRGENLWAKAQKDAVFTLYQYSVTGKKHYYEEFRHSLMINLGDRRAREALSATEPDSELARIGFLEGGNHPEDVPGLISFFIRFQRVEYMAQAIAIWARADEKIAQLLVLGDRIDKALAAGLDRDILRYQMQLDTLSSALQQEEIAFSSVLGEAARWIKGWLLVANLVLLLALLGIILLVARRMGRQLKHTESALRMSDNRYSSLVESNLIGIMEWNLDGQILFANQKFLDTVGYTPRDVKSGQLNWRELTPADQMPGDQAAVQEIRQYGMCAPYEKEYFHRDGHRVPVYLGAVLLYGERETGIGFVVDQTDKKRLENELSLSAVVMENSQDGIIILDAQRHIVKVNKAIGRLLGRDERALIGRSVCELYSCNSQALTAQIDGAFFSNDNWQGDVDFLLSSGEKHPVRMGVSVVSGDHLRFAHYVVMVSDIRERKVKEARLERRASHDPLTGLANRSLYSAILDKAIYRAQENNVHCGVIYLDLDDFKPINDNFGHETGDKLLQRVASRISGLMRSVDVVARLGGDEFAVIVEGMAEESILEEIAERIGLAVSRRYLIDGREFSIGCSLGTGLYPKDGSTAKELTRAADDAMYVMKKQRSRQRNTNPATDEL